MEVEWIPEEATEKVTSRLAKKPILVDYPKEYPFANIIAQTLEHLQFEAILHYQGGLRKRSRFQMERLDGQRSVLNAFASTTT